MNDVECIFMYSSELIFFSFQYRYFTIYLFIYLICLLGGGDFKTVFLTAAVTLELTLESRLALKYRHLPLSVSECVHFSTDLNLTH